VRHYRLGAHTKSGLKVHLVWVPKYRFAAAGRTPESPPPQSALAFAMEHELEMVSGKVARDHVHLFLSYRPNQEVSQMRQWLKRISSSLA
jgi:putative transposase